MQTVTRHQVISILEALGVRRGDGLLVHSALQFLGRPEGGVGMYYDALCTVLGIEIGQKRQVAGRANPVAQPSALACGTIAVPAFNFAFTRGEAFDRRETPSQGMGAFSEYVRQRPDALRTPHPIQSLAVVGLHAADLAGRDTPSAFDPGSAFERMLELGFQLLLLGAEIQAVSMVHYSEQRARVPYRYWKDFSGRVRVDPPNDDSGIAWWERRSYRMFARDLDLDPRLNLSPIQNLLQERRQWASLPLNYGRISLCRLVDFVKASDQLLAVDPWVLVENRPLRDGDQ